MNWWNKALYDTCSLITVDKILLDHGDMEKHFRGILALDESFSADQMRAETAKRMRRRSNIIELPTLEDVRNILAGRRLSMRLADVDRLVFAAGIHHGVAVLTGDRLLAKALLKEEVTVGNCAVVLKELLCAGILEKAKCEAILTSLVRRRDYVLPVNLPQTWETLRKYRFP